MNIPDEAIEAATYVFPWQAADYVDTETIRAALEAAYPILLSHERHQTADAHRDAIVNRDTVDRLERELAQAKAVAWDEGYMRGRHPWEKVGPFVDPIPDGVGPAVSGLNANPYRSGSGD